MKTYDLIIIGGGPAGLAAAVAAKDNGIDNILILERDKSLGCTLSGWSEAPDKSRHGALPIRILFPEGYGDSGKRSPNAG